VIFSCNSELARDKDLCEDLRRKELLLTNQLKDREYAIIEADRTLSIENTLTDKQRIEIDEL
jgi:hypothetical protein